MSNSRLPELDFAEGVSIIDSNMKLWITTIISTLSLFSLGLVNAAEAEKAPLNEAEIAELAAEEQADAQQLQDVEAGDLNAGAGIFILVVIGIGVLVAAN